MLLIIKQFVIIDPVLDAINFPFQYTSQEAYTGISINGVTNARIDSETRPKNMKVYFIMKVC